MSIKLNKLLYIYTNICQLYSFIFSSITLYFVFETAFWVWDLNADIFGKMKIDIHPPYYVILIYGSGGFLAFNIAAKCASSPTSMLFSRKLLGNAQFGSHLAQSGVRFKKIVRNLKFCDWQWVPLTVVKPSFGIVRSWRVRFLHSQCK